MDYPTGESVAAELTKNNTVDEYVVADTSFAYAPWYHVYRHLVNYCIDKLVKERVYTNSVDISIYINYKVYPYKVTILTSRPVSARYIPYLSMYKMYVGEFSNLIPVSMKGSFEHVASNECIRRQFINEYGVLSCVITGQCGNSEVRVRQYDLHAKGSGYEILTF